MNNFNIPEKCPKNVSLLSCMLSSFLLILFSDSSIYGQVSGEERQREYEQTGPKSAFK